MARRKKQINRGFSYWFPRISAISFVLLMYLIIAEDFIKTLYYHPVLYNFFIGTIVLAITIIVWNKERIACLIFILSGLIYFALMGGNLLFSSVWTTSLWLVFTGVLFWLDYIKNKSLKDRSKFEANPETKQTKPKLKFKFPVYLRRKI